MRSRTALTLLLLGVVAVVDLALQLRAWDLLTTGLLDWAGHLATAGLVLLAAHRMGLRPESRLLTVVLAASLLIDLDHIPLYAGVPGVEAAGGRPFTHSLLTPAVLLVVAAITRSRVVLAVAAGVLLHFLRDVATGPGLPALWPADLAVRAPYPAYAVLLVVLAAITMTPQRQTAGSSPPRRR